MTFHRQDSYDEHTTQALAENYQSILGLLGEDQSRDGLMKTPQRVAKAMQFFTQGYEMDAKEIL